MRPRRRSEEEEEMDRNGLDDIIHTYALAGVCVCPISRWCARPTPGHVHSRSASRRRLLARAAPAAHVLS